MGMSPAASAVGLIVVRLTKRHAALRDHSSAGGCLAWIFTCFLLIIQKAAWGGGKSSAYAGVSIKPLSPLQALGQLKGCSRLQHACKHPSAGAGKADIVLWEGRAGGERVKLRRELSCLP